MLPYAGQRSELDTIRPMQRHLKRTTNSKRISTLFWLCVFVSTTQAVTAAGPSAMPALPAPATLPTATSAGQPGSDDTAYLRAQQRVDIGGRRLNLVCIGQGTPTVIFDSGLGDWSFSWSLVQPQIGKLTRTCSYDRAGLGFSDPAVRPSTSANMVDDLHRLLRAAAIAPPYMLVGHSLGGLNMQLFAARHASEVAGMVLVDASHEETIARIDAATHGAQTRHWRLQAAHDAACAARVTAEMGTADFRGACIEPDDARFSKALNQTRVAVARHPAFQQAQLSEARHYLDGVSFAQVRAAHRQLDALPLVVLTSGRTIAEAGPEWLTLQKELAGLSRSGTQRTVAGAGHYLQLDAPEAVIDAIGNLLKMLAGRLTPSRSR